MYGNFTDSTLLPEDRVYDEIEDQVKITDTVYEYLGDFNAISRKKMNLVLFTNAIEHISRIARVIMQPRGNALLVGVGGSGRKSLTTLAASIEAAKCFQVHRRHPMTLENARLLFVQSALEHLGLAVV